MVPVGTSLGQLLHHQASIFEFTFNEREIREYSRIVGSSKKTYDKKATNTLAPVIIPNLTKNAGQEFTISK